MTQNYNTIARVRTGYPTRAPEPKDILVRMNVDGTVHEAGLLASLKQYGLLGADTRAIYLESYVDGGARDHFAIMDGGKTIGSLQLLGDDDNTLHNRAAEGAWRNVMDEKGDSVYEVWYTTAPAAYDYSYVRASDATRFEATKEGAVLRRVEIPRASVAYQTARYMSGLHIAINEEQAEHEAQQRYALVRYARAHVAGAYEAGIWLAIVGDRLVADVLRQARIDSGWRPGDDHPALATIAVALLDGSTSPLARQVDRLALLGALTRHLSR
ncbi:MAG: hypothetical protein H0U69_03640 [Trueperaceae bacterium]|nr:hypothetical protein [Trueperaceae bacterium]